MSNDENRISDLIDGGLHQQNEEQKALEEMKTKWIALSEDEKNILGRPNFACAKIAHRMRGMGFDVKRKAEDEQALVIFTMLEFYKEHGSAWAEKINQFLNPENKEIV